MSENEDTPAAKKEAAVLTNDSMNALSKELGQLGLVTAMYLNIPTTKLAVMRMAADENASEEDKTYEALLYWKQIRAGAKDRDKVYDLERALREAGKQDAADTLLDRHRDNVELTEDCFPADD